MIKGQDSSSPARPDAPGNGRAPGSKRAASEARLLKAAEEVFAQTGFAGARTAQIAQRAGLPKANLHYYFRTKEAIYQRVLENVLEVWLGMGNSIQPGVDPTEALTRYIAAKVEHSRRRPFASKVFANEILHGAPQLKGYLRSDLRKWVDAKARIIESWSAAGKMAQVDGRHLLFLIWAMTQTYADFDVQVAAVLGRDRLAPRDYQEATALITRLLLAGCGLKAHT